MAKAKKKDTFEARLKRLEEIVRKLEEADPSLESGLALFKEGLELTKLCRKQLEDAGHEVKVLSQGVLRDFEAKDNGD
ncbi:MAG: exodeoxyribonuclease VII small subunit [Thermodesulfobacteriota bacterium]|nr:exodeoxyribonuclease VII small subunit [Thermodesulfobacteriota bacterium]